MKILWISHLVPYPPRAGVLIRSYNLVKQLSSRHEVDLFMFNQKNLLAAFYRSQDEGLDAAIDALKPFVDRHWIVPIQYERSFIHKLFLIVKSFLSITSPYTINWLQSKTAHQQLRKILSERDYDLVHFDTVSLDIYRRQVKPGTSVTLNHHNIESHMMGRRAAREKNLLKKLYFQLEFLKLRRYEHRFLADYDGHIVCSRDDAARLSELTHAKAIEVIPNGIDMSGEEPTKSITAGTLLFIGGLSWYPNRDAMLHFFEKIYPSLKCDNQNIKVDIIGRNAPPTLIEIASNDNSVTVHGYVENIKEFYIRSNIYICPIRDGGGTKLKMLDAFANKMAVVAYPLACEGLDVTHNEDVMIAQNPDEFAIYVSQLVRDIGKCTDLGNRAYSVVKNRYNYESIGNKLSSFYSGLSARRNAPRSGS